MTKSFWLIAPYAAWMVLMSLLPATVTGYAVRTAVVAALLLASWFATRGFRTQTNPTSQTSQTSVPSPIRLFDYSIFRSFLHSFLVGIAVFVIWILPEQFGWGWYGRCFIYGEGGTQAVAEASAAMIAVRLFGSAFVISAAEELFFRKWLIGFAGFWWMVGLFAIEHDRWLVGAIAGIVYGWLYLRKGLWPAIVAHATTNLVLGIWVFKTGQWQFW